MRIINLYLKNIFQEYSRKRYVIPFSRRILFFLIFGAVFLTAANAQTGCAVVISEPAAIGIPVAEVTVVPDCKTEKGTLTITSPLGTDYRYSVDGLNYYSSPVFELIPDTYTVTVKNSTGCISDPATVTIDRFCIPNGFTPNGDEFNQTFEILHPANMKIKLTIFNRWGNQVYESNDYQNDWEGKGVGNEYVPNGTYYYIAEFTNSASGTKKTYTGYVVIKR